METDAGNEAVLAAIEAIATPALEVLARVLLRYPTRLMDAILACVTQELAHRQGLNHHPRFVMPPLAPWECRVGASECLGVSEFCDEACGRLFSVLAAALVAEAENTPIADPLPN